MMKIDFISFYFRTFFSFLFSFFFLFWYVFDIWKSENRINLKWIKRSNLKNSKMVTNRRRKTREKAFSRLVEFVPWTSVPKELAVKTHTLFGRRCGRKSGWLQFTIGRHFTMTWLSVTMFGVSTSGGARCKRRKLGSDSGGSCKWQANVEKLHKFPVEKGSKWMESVERANVLWK